MAESILSQAQAWGFLYKCDEENNCQISPQNTRECWKLQQNENKWLLIVNGVAQVICCEQQALSFLKRRCRVNNSIQQAVRSNFG